METLSLDTIANVDNGVVAVAFDKVLRTLQMDCEDRATLKKARVINLQVSLVPVADHDHLVRIDTQFHIKSTIPEKSTVCYPMHVTNDGIQFRPEIGDNPGQRPLPYGKDEE